MPSETKVTLSGVSCIYLFKYLLHIIINNYYLIIRSIIRLIIK